MDPELRYKIQYRDDLKTFDEVIAEAYKHSIRMEEKRAAKEKREFVNAITQGVQTPQDPLLSTVLETVQKQQETINAILADRKMPDGKQKLANQVTIPPFRPCSTARTSAFFVVPVMLRRALVLSATFSGVKAIFLTEGFVISFS